MVGAGRTVAGWLGGRLLLFVLALAVLVLAGVMQDRGSVLRGHLDALVPDAQLAQELQSQQQQLKRSVQRSLDASNKYLKSAHTQSRDALARRAADLDAQVRARTARRPGTADWSLALLTGNRVGELAENEAMIQLLSAERDQLMRLIDAMDRLGVSPAGARANLAAAQADYRQKRVEYLRLDAELAAYERLHPTALLPFEVLGIDNATRREYLALLETRNAAVRAYNASSARLARAKQAVAEAGKARLPPAANLSWPESPLLTQFDELVAEKTARVERTRKELAELRDRVRRTAWQAFWAVVVISLSPLVLKAFWYYVMAPLAARRPPIQLLPPSSPALRPGGVPAPEAGATRISAVSQEIALAPGEDLLVHPEYVQSLPHAGAKRTQWLLSSSLPVTSLASGMVALTRVSGTGAPCTVASKQDPFTEIAVVEVPAGTSLVLQPRSLAGLVQPAGGAVRIVSRWNLGLGALITLQFRYLLFEGPVRLIVAGGRGIRQEPAGQGRSIDQNQTIGFSANLAYSPRRSETFGAYLLGVNGLFNDSFAGSPGIYVYEEMPYLGRRGGITGRGLQGVSDVLLKFFGI